MKTANAKGVRSPSRRKDRGFTPIRIRTSIVRNVAQVVRDEADAIAAPAMPKCGINATLSVMLTSAAKSPFFMSNLGCPPIVKTVAMGAVEMLKHWPHTKAIKAVAPRVASGPKMERNG